ncbi:MAG TPA: VanZ family protein [Steroidobacteraceae bacterium]|jgi:VanZ family protein|nr:VanZ family protein [Steroidobacteraceae bacterium]
MATVQLRYPKFWVAMGWLAVAFTIFICLLPGKDLPPTGMSDKVEHLTAYTLLSLWFAGVYPRTRYWVIALGLLVLGISIEFGQYVMHAGRQADVRDVLANSTGIIVGLTLAWLGLGQWTQRLESLVVRKA